MSLRWYAFLCGFGSDVLFTIDYFRSISFFCQNAHHDWLTKEYISNWFLVVLFQFCQMWAVKLLQIKLVFTLVRQHQLRPLILILAGLILRLKPFLSQLAHTNCFVSTYLRSYVTTKSTSVCTCWSDRRRLQWRNFVPGCPWARDGWVPHWLRSAYAKFKKSKRAMRASLAAWGPGARLRAPVGSRGKAPGGGPGGEAPGSSWAFQCRNRISDANLYT